MLQPPCRNVRRHEETTATIWPFWSEVVFAQGLTHNGSVQARYWLGSKQCELHASVAELVDALDLGSSGSHCAGSIPVGSTISGLTVLLRNTLHLCSEDGLHEAL